MANPIQIRNTIDDELYTAFINSDAVTQKNILDEVTEDELT